MARLITFLSDYGLADEFVGVVHAVIAGICPQARVIDLAHGVPRQDVVAGALALARALPFTPAGVHLAVVDPEVGARRRAVALRTDREDRLLVGPDNGLLLIAADRFGGVAEAVEISASPWCLQPMSATFHGRDVFAPVAARLAGGAPLAQAGAPLAPAELVRIDLPRARVDGPGALRAHALAFDAYGNVGLDAGRADLAAAGLGHGTAIRVEADGAWHPAHVARTFADVAVGELVLLEDSAGQLALAVNSGSAAERLGVARCEELRIVAA